MLITLPIFANKRIKTKNMESYSLMHTICEICMAAGGLGTVGTLVYMICDSKRKAKQIMTVQQIQSHQLEALYEPDIRINSYGGVINDIVIRNYGENLSILDIRESDNSGYLNKEGMKRWFPLHFDKGAEINIPLHVPPTKIQSLCIKILCRNRLGQTYETIIEINNGKPAINKSAII